LILFGGDRDYDLGLYPDLVQEFFVTLLNVVKQNANNSFGLIIPTFQNIILMTRHTHVQRIATESICFELQNHRKQLMSDSSHLKWRAASAPKRLRHHGYCYVTFTMLTPFQFVLPTSWSRCLCRRRRPLASRPTVLQKRWRRPTTPTPLRRYLRLAAVRRRHRPTTTFVPLPRRLTTWTGKEAGRRSLNRHRLHIAPKDQGLSRRSNLPGYPHRNHNGICRPDFAPSICD